MEIASLFKNALNYPLSDYKKLIILGIVTIISQLATISYSINNGGMEIVSVILGIIGLIFTLIIAGYVLSVIKEGIDGSDAIPDFEWGKNFIMGIKYVILEIVYYIIPAIIILIVAAVTGVFDSTVKIIEQMQPTLVNETLNSATVQASFAQVPQSTLNAFTNSLTITGIVAIILAILFAFFLIVATCRLADTGSLKSALNLKKVFEDLSAIGWGSFVIWFIVLLIISFIIFFIMGLVVMIPIIGVILIAFIVGPYLTLFAARAMGLMYAEK